MKVKDIPQNILTEIDFMLGSIEECNSEYMLPILLNHNIDPHGGWLDINDLTDDAIIDIYEKLFESGTIVPFFTDGDQV